MQKTRGRDRRVARSCSDYCGHFCPHMTAFHQPETVSPCPNHNHQHQQPNCGHADIQEFSETSRTSPREEEDDDDNTSSSQPTVAAPTIKRCGRLLPAAERRTRAITDPGATRTLLLLSLVVSFTLESLVLCAGPGADSFGEYLINRQRSLEQLAAGAQLDDLARPFSGRHHQHADCTHRNTDSHKSHQLAHRHYHYSQATGSVAGADSYHEQEDERQHEHEHERRIRDHYHSASESDHDRSPPTNEPPVSRRTASNVVRHGPTQSSDASEYLEDTSPLLRAPVHSERQSTCDDCLAIPLVALVGDKQISGFIIPPSSSLRRQSSRERQTQVQQLAHRQRQQPSYSYGAYEQPTVASLEPKSDEKCPMTGPLTVCDHIGSYPTDVILEKLDSAKKRLGESHFNLDSFFSDERENSGDPFERRARATSANNRASKLAARHMTNATISGGYPGEPSANIYSRPASQDDSYQQQTHQTQPERRTRANKGHNYQGEQTNRRPDRAHKLRSRTESVPQTYAGLSEDGQAQVQEEFVDLVERRAISLSERRQPSAAREMIQQEETSHTSAGATARQHPSDRASGRGSRRPISTSEQAAVAATRAARRKLNDDKSEAATSTRAADQTEQRRSALGEERNRRSRRQAASVRVTASSDGPMLSADSPQRNSLMSGNMDMGAESDGPAPAREDQTSPGDADAAAAENQAEPVCRAKSIYISPRAALNDKKQWKYVVNAPERNPQIRQVIRVDICQDPFGPCSDQVSIPFGFTSECKQKYAKKKLLALDAKSGLLEVDTFFIPSCCVCQLIRANPDETSSSLGRAAQEESDASQPATADPASTSRAPDESAK